MLHLANDYIRNNIITGHSPQVSAITQEVFSSANIELVKSQLEKDSVSYLYSSLISFFDALNGLKQGFYSWPTVKLYYSVFYGLRAYLGFNDICLFYVGTKAYSIDLKIETKAKKEVGNTHKAVLDVFKKSFPMHILLTQDIDQKHPFDWFTELREYANYKNPKFCEPITPPHFSKVVDLRLEKALQSYNADKSYLYVFDSDHACIAYPLKILKSVLAQFIARGLVFNELDAENLNSVLSQIDGAKQCFNELEN